LPGIDDPGSFSGMKISFNSRSGPEESMWISFVIFLVKPQALLQRTWLQQLRREQLRLPTMVRNKWVSGKLGNILSNFYGIPFWVFCQFLQPSLLKLFSFPDKCGSELFKVSHNLIGLHILRFPCPNVMCRIPCESGLFTTVLNW
jgi:hypothetical protein